jgi:hypothetical protein
MPSNSARRQHTPQARRSEPRLSTIVAIAPGQEVPESNSAGVLYRAQFWRKRPGWLLCYYKPAGSRAT